MAMALPYTLRFRARLCWAERSSEAAIRSGCFQVKRPGSRSSTGGRRFTSAAQSCLVSCCTLVLEQRGGLHAVSPHPFFQVAGLVVTAHLVATGVGPDRHRNLQVIDAVVVIEKGLKVGR